MATPGPNRPAETASSPATHPNGDFAALRDLLLGPERAELEELRERIRDHSQRTADLSEVLPDAILLRARKDHRLTHALQPLLEEAFATSIRRDPRVLTEVLFPIITRAVRRAVGSALQGMVESLNQIIETSVSLRSVSWRLEAMRTGKSYGEIALVRSLLYRVEQVFLIQNETGLLLQHVIASSVVVRDPDMVSGMLTAIQNFVQDSFGAADNTLDAVRVGDYSVWVQHGPQALLAAVISGTAPMKAREVFSLALENIHLNFTKQLTDFDGDCSILDGAKPALQSCLLGQSPPGKRASRLPLYLLGLILIAAITVWAGISIRDARRWQRYVAALREQPGIVVTHAERSGRAYRIAGLRDPLAADPSQLFSAASVPADRVSAHWEPYLSLLPQFVARREMEAAKARLDQLVIHFDTGKSALLPAESIILRDTANAVRTVLRDTAVRVDIVGHTDELGAAEMNDQLGLERAKAVHSVLAAAGVDAARLNMRSAGTREPVQTAGANRASENRSVTFRVLPAK